MEQLTLKIGGVEISGWINARITRGIERMPSDFDLSVTNYMPNAGDQFVNEGDSCELYLSKDKVITGYIDRITKTISPQEHSIRVSGRGKCQDLVDCSAEYEGNVINNVTAFSLTQKLALKHGIEVRTDVKNFEKVPQFTINWGESSQEIIERVCRWAGLLYYDLPDGSLFLTRVGKGVAASGIEQGINIQQAEYSCSLDQRFSEYVGVSLGVSAAYSLGSNYAYDSVFLAKANDPEVSKLRKRKHISVVESTLIQKNLAQTAMTWEMNRRYGRSKVVKAKIDSWRDKNGELWAPNTLIPIKAPALGLENEKWLLSEVEFIKDEKEGTTAQLTLMPAQAFIVQPYEFYADALKGPSR